MNLSDIREYVVRPTLQRLGMLDLNRVQLVVGTGAVESGYQWLDQSTPGEGPAYGPWQMEKLTHDDLWRTFIPYQPTALQMALRAVAGCQSHEPPHVRTLHGNLFYGAAMCAMKYRRVRSALPPLGDFEGMAVYWKQWYNTPLGKGTVEKAIPFFRQAVQS